MPEHRTLTPAELMNLVFEQAGVALCLVAPDLTVSCVNAEWRRWTGCGADQVEGMDILAVFPETRDLSLSFYERVQHGETVNIPRHGERVLGREAWWEGQLSPVQMRDGTGILITARDASAPAALSERHHQLLFDTMLQGVVYQDAEGRIISLNPSAERILGKARSELVGKSSVAFEHHTIRQDGTPFPGLEHPSMIALRTGREQRDVVMGVFNPREQGHRWISISAVPLFRSGEARPYQVYTVFEDVTDRNRAEEGLRLRLHVTNTPLAMIEWDAEFRVTSFSARAEALFGWSADEIVGRTIDELPWVPGEDWPAVRTAMRDLSRGARRTTASSRRNIRKDGSVIYCEWYDSALHDASGNLASVLSLVLDVTQREHAEQALRESEARARSRAAELQAVLDAVPASVFIARDREASHIDANRYCSRVLRMPPGANVSKSAPREERPRTFRTMKAGREIPPEQLPIQVAASRGVEVLDSEFDLAFDDGVVRHLVGNAAPLRDASGEVTGAVGAFVDITDRKRAEETLRASEEKLRLAQEAAKMGSWDWDLASGAIVASDRGMALLGRSPGTVLTYDAFLGAIHPDDRDRVERAVKDALASCTDYDVEMRVPSPNGTVRWIAARGRGFYDSGGEPVRMAGLALDVTDRKRAEEALREQLALKDQLAKIAASVPGLICSYRLRPDGSACFPFTTPIAEELWGISQEAVAKDAAPLFANIHPDDVQRVTDVIRDAARTLSRWHDEFRYLHPTKGLCWFEGWSVPRAEPDGSILWHGYVMDVTERKRGEEALRASESKYRTLYTQTPVMMHSIDREGRLVSVSDHWLESLGYQREEVIGRRSVEFLTPESCKYAEEVVLPEYFRTGSCRDVPYQLVKKNGEVIDVLLSAIAERGADGKFSRSLAVIVDVTRRKRAEEALRESDRRKSEFLGILSHELRNPLAPIRNSIYLLDRATPGSEQAARARDVIRRQTEHLTRLVDDLLDVTRISRGKIELQRAPLDLRQIVRRTCDDLRSVFDGRGIELRVETAGPVWVEADETRIAQVVGNLIQNAAKFCGEGGTVTASVETAAGEAKLRVLDNGIGITPELLPRVFEPFVQADSGLARTKGGLGLGLALVKGIVGLHGGSVRASSEGPGRGAEFVVSLPLAPAPPHSQPRSAAKGSARAVDILVIEDNVDAAQTMAEILEMQGHRVHVATDGRSGLARARELRPEIVLCDIGLPDVDGYEIARRLRAEEATRSVRLIAVSGYAQPEDRRQAKEAGFDAHVSKPSSLDALLASMAIEGERS